MKFLLFIGAAYLLGSIPFGLLVARAVKGIDVRQYGSGNIGATNVFRVVGKKWGVCVFLLDALKGALAILWPVFILAETLPAPVKIALGVTAILGHSFPVWLRFKGGKGVATSLGVFLAIVPAPAGATFLFWMLVFFLTRILSVASLAAAVFFPLVLFFMIRGAEIFPWVFPVSFCLAAFIFFTHRANIRRLLKGEEKRLF